MADGIETVLQLWARAKMGAIRMLGLSFFDLRATAIACGVQDSEVAIGVSKRSSGSKAPVFQLSARASLQNEPEDQQAASAGTDWIRATRGKVATVAMVVDETNVLIQEFNGPHDASHALAAKVEEIAFLADIFASSAEIEAARNEDDGFGYSAVATEARDLALHCARLASEAAAQRARPHRKNGLIESSERSRIDTQNEVLKGAVQNLLSLVDSIQPRDVHLQRASK